jgi:hypothetical protein
MPSDPAKKYSKDGSISSSIRRQKKKCLIMPRISQAQLMSTV